MTVKNCFECKYQYIEQTTGNYFKFHCKLRNVVLVNIEQINSECLKGEKK